MTRFQVDTTYIDHSCCYGAQVVDTDKPIIIGNEHYRNQFATVCECYDIETAAMIAEALNRRIAK